MISHVQRIFNYYLFCPPNGLAKPEDVVTIATSVQFLFIAPWYHELTKQVPALCSSFTLNRQGLASINLIGPSDQGRAVTIVIGESHLRVNDVILKTTSDRGMQRCCVSQPVMSQYTLKSVIPRFCRLSGFQKFNSRHEI